VARSAIRSGAQERSRPAISSATSSRRCSQFVEHEHPVGSSEAVVQHVDRGPPGFVAQPARSQHRSGEVGLRAGRRQLDEPVHR